MASFQTLINGDKWFAFGYARKQNIVHPHHWQAMMQLVKYNGHISSKPISSDFAKTKFSIHLSGIHNPYMLGEHSIRLFHRANKYLETNSVENFEEFLLEALIFDCYKVYPPGDKYSPELTERGQRSFEKKYIKFTRKILKENSNLVRSSLGLDFKVNPILIDLNKQLQSDELHYLQFKANSELELMGLPRYGKVLDLRSKKECEEIRPLSTSELTLEWWSNFISLHGWQRYKEYGVK